MGGNGNNNKVQKWERIEYIQSEKGVFIRALDKGVGRVAMNA